LFSLIQSIFPIKSQKKTILGKGNSLSNHVLKPVFVREYNTPCLPDLDRDKIITAKVVPIKYLWKSIERKHKIYIALYTFRLPRGFIIRDGFKPEGVFFYG
jgi:hypothetical protein